VRAAAPIGAARKLGADRIISLSRTPVRQAVAKAFGATDLVEERGADAAALSGPSAAV
jgi:Zn-dependent alcohol dehydrogenase